MMSNPQGIASLAQTHFAEHAGLRSELAALYATGRTRPASWRIRQLAAIERLLDERADELASALAADLGRSAAEAWLGDLASTKAEAKYARKRLRLWMLPRPKTVPTHQFPALGWVRYQPLGTVLIIGPWNYPVYLALAPLVAAVAAGNCAVVKPSELAPVTSALLARLIPQYLDDAVRVVEGDAQTTQSLISAGFDHVFFTGGTGVGRKVMLQAAETLTPVTLELGGKSPVVVTADADLDVAARRIAWVKLMNAGQTCIAPDYVLVEASVRTALVTRLCEVIDVFRRDADAAGMRVVDRRQFERLASYLAGTSATVATGGEVDPETLSIWPTVLVDPDPTEPVMTDEIFGPILPVLSVESAAAAIDFIGTRPKPLAAYLFSRSRRTQRQFLADVDAGAVVINHVGMHVLAPQLPFGGVGDSGIGGYHGRYGFETLSHRKAVLYRPQHPDPTLAYPPYTPAKLRLMRRLF